MTVARVASTVFMTVIISHAQPSPDYGRHLHWEGVLNGPATLSIQAWTVNVNDVTQAAVGYYRYQMSFPLPDAGDYDVVLTASGGHAVRITQQPRNANQHVALIQIDVKKRTRVSFDLLYRKYPNTWFDAPRAWWVPRDVVRWSGHGQGSITVECRQRRCEVKNETLRRMLPIRFDFVLGLPDTGDQANIADPLGATDAGIRIVEQPSKQNRYTTRVSVGLHDSSDYGFTLTWLHSMDHQVLP